MTSIFITCLFCVNLLSIYVAFKYCRQKNTGRKKAARTRAKGYRDLQNRKVKLDNKTKEAERYKKRWQRMQNVQRDTPRSKTRRMLGGVKVRESVRKTLLFHNARITGLRDKYKNLKSERERQVYSKVVASRVLKRYKFKKHAQQVLVFSRKRSSVFDQDLRTISYEKKVYSSAGIKVKTSVTDFYTRDDNSYMTPGKKETVTRNKTKMQKRLLLDSMTNLHKNYLRENSGSKMGYTLSCKFSPFWVVKPGLTDRQTCLCKKHANWQFKADRLHQLGVLSEKNIGTLVEGLACDRQRKRCMYNECPTCCSNVPKYVGLDQDPNTHVIWWWEWVLKKKPWSYW